MPFTTPLVDYYPWLMVSLAGAVAVTLALVAHYLLVRLARRLARPSILASTIVEYAEPPARLVMPLFALQFVIAGAPPDLPFVGLAATILSLLLIAALTWLAMRVITGGGEAVIVLNPADVADNLQARRIQTQTRVLTRTLVVFVMLIGAASALMTLPGMRQIGTTLLASAGLAGLVVGMAARPVFGNLIAGLQIALSQPIRLDDVVIIEGEWGRIEEIKTTYVVVKIWDDRRLVVPLQWIIEHPFQNWTRRSSQLLGTVLLWVDYRVPLQPLREELKRACKAAPEWDGRVAIVQVVETSERAIQLRALVSAADAAKTWDLRCRVREALVDFLQREYPDSLPRLRAELDRADKHPPRTEPAPPPERAGEGESSAIVEPTHSEIEQAGDSRAPAAVPDNDVTKGH